MYAEVAVSRASSGTDKLFDYLIPPSLENKITVGQPVMVPFGRRRETGYVVGIKAASEVKGLKEVIEIAPDGPVLTAPQIELAKWLSEYYLSFFLTALKLFLPPPGKIPNNKLQITNNTKIQIFKSQVKLTDEQQVALSSIVLAVESNQAETFLLYGVTGSGKTEVYLRAIARGLELGRSAIALVPEIGLTPQLVQRFRARFGEQIAVLHSDLTLKERRREWGRVASGEARIVLGTRLALFAPVRNLGIVILDEEYETTYKSEKSPRYHAREAALKLAELNNAVVVLGSATPSVETYYRAERCEFQKLSLPKRIDDRPLPPVAVVDMREELEHKNFGVLSELLKAELLQTLSRGEQAILFMNRLGYFTFVMCRQCGLTIECPQCSVSLVYHTSAQELRCGRCGYAAKSPVICPRCHSSSIKYFGTGTQRIEDEVAKVFPAARILRYDRDTVSKRGSHEIFFAAFAEKKADVLIGTQMVAKGLDIASVTLVGVVSADTALHLPDFRSAERTFQLLTQVAGRAGRHHLPGKVIIQTYNPEHYAIAAAAGHDYEKFYRQEIEFRRELGYPPFSKLIGLLIGGADQKAVSKSAAGLAENLNLERTEVLGPAPAAIARQRGQWRYRILLKGQDLGPLRQAAKEALAKTIIPPGVKVSVDVDPLGML